MKIWIVLTIAVIGIVLPAHAADPDRIRSELERLAEDYEKDPNRRDVLFGMRIDGRDWTITSEGGGVTVADGAPPRPTWILAGGSKAFLRIASGDMSALTAMAQARSTDPTLLSLEMSQGFEFDGGAQQDFLSVLFHFFVTGQPEIVPLGTEHARVVHGGNALPIYYAPHLRTSWYSIGPGQHINRDPKTR